MHTHESHRANGAEVPDARGYYGEFGGRFVPETLMPALAELEQAYLEAMADRSFGEEFDQLCRDYIGRPTPLYHARRLSEKSGGAAILLLLKLNK